MNARHRTVLALAGAALALTAGASAQPLPSQFVVSGKAAARLHDTISINGETAEKVAHVCEDIARKNNSQVVVVILEPSGLVVHEHRMDGEGYIQVKATEAKALTSLRTRAPSKVLANREATDPNSPARLKLQYDLASSEGGFPIIVNGQLIGAIGVGGIPPNERTPTFTEETCARDALVAVFGPQPPLVPDPRPAGRGGN